MAAKQAQIENNAQEVEVQPNGSKFMSCVRFILVAVLVAYMLKPYFFDKAQADNSALQNFAVHGKTMGTTWSALICTTAEELIEINSSDTNESDEAIDSCEVLLSRIIQRELDKIDSLASTYKPDSDISKFNASRSTDWFTVSPETAKIVAIALEAAQKTEGAFDPTVAPLVNLYRFGPNKAQLTALPTDEQIDAIRPNVGYTKLEARLDPPALKKSVPELSIDLSGVAKGFSVDLAAEALENVGLTSYMIEVGGEIRCRGTKIDLDTLELKPWTLGIQTPEVVQNDSDAHAPEMYRLLYFSDAENSAVLATSGDYRNFLQVGNVRFSHIVDPRTGKPTEIVDEAQVVEKRLGSVSIASNSSATLSCAVADAYATAFFVLGAEKGLELADKLDVAVLYLFRTDDSAVNVSEVASSAFEKLGSKTLAEALEVENSTDRKSK